MFPPGVISPGYSSEEPTFSLAVFGPCLRQLCKYIHPPASSSTLTLHCAIWGRKSHARCVVVWMDGWMAGWGGHSPRYDWTRRSGACEGPGQMEGGLEVTAWVTECQKELRPRARCSRPTRRAHRTLWSRVTPVMSAEDHQLYQGNKEDERGRKLSYGTILFHRLQLVKCESEYKL